MQVEPKTTGTEIKNNSLSVYAYAPRGYDSTEALCQEPRRRRPVGMAAGL